MSGARTTFGVVALTCALALTGCTPDGPAGPTPSPTPASQTPTETAQERQQRLDYAAAEKSYRTFRAEYERVLRAGGAREPTPLMKQTAGGDYLKTFSDVVRAFHDNGSRDKGNEAIVYVRPSGYSPNSLVLGVCEDSSSVVTVTKSGRRARGEFREATLQVHKVSSTWKVWAGTGRLVKSCE